ncbi:MAG: PLP-dependent transferase, partial [Bacteroidetes bacterium]|nr:PLP-dependent transferase [Bacteroidota bacterium]
MTEEEIILHHGENEPEFINAFSPPVYQTSNFRFQTVDAMRHALQSEKEISVYSRGNNPTVRLFEKKMASLEKTEDALAFSSGIAAITCSILNSVKAGDHIIAIEEVYGWTKVFFDQYLPGFGITTSYFNGNDLSELNSIIQANTKLIYLESPSSWFFSIQDLKSISEIARSRNIRTICDNSFASPLGQNPSQFGIDLIVHSASKYLGGHSDLVGGVVCGPSEILSGLFKEEYMNLGAIMSPNTAWLLIRGLRTLS